MREPLWWVWLSTFTSLYVFGSEYCGVPRGSARASCAIASIVRAACGDRHERRT